MGCKAPSLAICSIRPRCSPQLELNHQSARGRLLIPPESPPVVSLFSSTRLWLRLAVADCKGRPVASRCRRGGARATAPAQTRGGVRARSNRSSASYGGPGDDEDADILRSSSDPFQMLGVSDECNIDDLKAAFRAKVKEYHPDVNDGSMDANVISQRLIEAYKALLAQLEGQAGTERLKSVNPFEEPEGPASRLFVNELRCVGRGCAYSCVKKAKGFFQFVEETGRARATTAAVDVDDYSIQVAVDQCPELCIHFVTPKQKAVLEKELASIITGFASPATVGVELDGLLAKARYENGRERGKKRTVKKTGKYVDWL